MKKLVLTAMIAVVGMMNAQESAFSGKNDLRLDVGAHIQQNATGIAASLDYGLGQSFSVGLQGGYLLGVPEEAGEKPKIGDRFDFKVRASAHLGEVIGLPSNVDVYPGLNLSLKNFGGHIGGRYFFSKGFGVFAEAQFPIAKYNDDAKDFQNLNNQFGMFIGASFDLNAQ